jgi:hypothetical protein
MGWRCVSMRAVVLMTVLLPAGATRAQDASQLPDDPAKDMLLKNCVDCHNIDVVIGKHQNSADWKSTIARMSGYGINMPADEIDHLTDYLARVQGLTSSRPKAAPR